MRPFNDYSLNNNGATDTKKKIKIDSNRNRIENGIRDANGAKGQSKLGTNESKAATLIGDNCWFCGKFSLPAAEFDAKRKNKTS